MRLTLALRRGVLLSVLEPEGGAEAWPPCTRHTCVVEALLAPIVMLAVLVGVLAVLRRTPTGAGRPGVAQARRRLLLWAIGIVGVSTAWGWLYAEPDGYVVRSVRVDLGSAFLNGLASAIYVGITLVLLASLVESRPGD